MPLPTEFAPAERAPDEEVDRVARYFRNVAHLMAIIDGVPDMVLVLNPQRQIVLANAVVEQTVGVPETAARGQRVGELLDCDHADNNTGGCGTSQFCQTCGAVQAMLASFRGNRSVQECRITKVNGEALDLRVFATPYPFEGQTYSIFTIQDIRHEKRRLALERIFFHDITNIASAAFGVAELYKEIGHQEATPEMDDILLRQLARLLEEIAVQRDLAYAESGDLAVRLGELNTLEVLHEVRDTYQTHKVGVGRSIVLEPTSANTQFISDGVLLGRVLGNLLKNALEASGVGETVTLGCFLEGDYVLFTVHNRAVMPRHVQLQIFNRSFSTKDKSRGLGTYSVKLLTEQYLQGKVTFSSNDGEGTLFCVGYPIQPL